ncbi:hypothetical protein GQ44DRAFT_729252 [Phaeosphaeriaceae sp. PMI808]|nr:hypothetical protein GQ44DRAFT_729252 [Phaeosphaeriaceae sp. PMI808]
MSFLPTCKEVPLELLFRGATPRRRWTVQGEGEESDAIASGLCLELQNLLSDQSKMLNAVQELDLLPAASGFDQPYGLNEQVTLRVRENVPIEQVLFWRCQALIVVYRAIPWKYLEPIVANTMPFLPYLEHVVKSFGSNFDCLSTSTRADLALTLLEASRFPTMSWKRFTISQSEVVARGLDYPCLRSCIARSRCLLARLAGSMDEAVNSLGHLNYDKPLCTVVKRMHSAVGLMNIQRSLNHIQNESMSVAQETLEEWKPVGQPSLMEEAVLIRQHMLLGKVLQFMGNLMIRWNISKVRGA